MKLRPRGLGVARYAASWMRMWRKRKPHEDLLVGPGPDQSLLMDKLEVNAGRTRGRRRQQVEWPRPQNSCRRSRPGRSRGARLARADRGVQTASANIHRSTGSCAPRRRESPPLSMARKLLDEQRIAPLRSPDLPPSSPAREPVRTLLDQGLGRSHRESGSSRREPAFARSRIQAGRCSRSSGRAMQTRRMGASRVRSVRYSTRSRNVGSAQ